MATLLEWQKKKRFGWLHYQLSSFRLIRKKSNKGFTLLELIVVMIVISILSAISIPVFQRQIGKARESEVKLKMGAIARSQTSYHYSQGGFAPTMALLAADTGPISSYYYTFPDPITDAVKVKHQAVSVNPGQFQTRDYAVGVYYISEAYGRSTCQGFDIGASVNVGDLPFDPCTNNGIRIE